MTKVAHQPTNGCVDVPLEPNVEIGATVASRPAMGARVLARHRFYALRIQRVVRETESAVSLAFEVPLQLVGTFAYRAGQFVTVRVSVEGEEHVRNYSMSSSPEVDPDLEVTVKRVPGGVVSNWMNDHVTPGAVLEVNPPGGSFVLGRSDDDVIAFAAGSGITPVYSIVKTALASTTRRVRLLYANRDRSSTIFADALDVLRAQHADRLVIEHHFDEERGLIDGGEVTSFIGSWTGGEIFICGPTPFMETVEATLTWIGIPRANVHTERFAPAATPDPTTGEPDHIGVVITMGRNTVTAAHHAGATILQTARSAGLRAPSSCETGSCATCMARVVEGRAEMRNNEALTADEVTEGWVLTCQAVPSTPLVKVVYE